MIWNLQSGRFMQNVIALHTSIKSINAPFGSTYFCTYRNFLFLKEAVLGLDKHLICLYPGQFVNS